MQSAIEATGFFKDGNTSRLFHLTKSTYLALYLVTQIFSSRGNNFLNMHMEREEVKMKFIHCIF